MAVSTTIQLQLLLQVSKKHTSRENMIGCEIALEFTSLLLKYLDEK